MIEPDETGDFDMNAREPMVVAGVEIAAEVFRRYDPRLTVEVRVKDGDRVEKGTILVNLTGPAQGILTGERTALNILQRMCGIATETARYVEVIKGTRARLIDTRKTTPWPAHGRETCGHLRGRPQSSARPR
jgi:nicotinate-nucleotide pyrophosphorylase (carboxylating)